MRTIYTIFAFLTLCIAGSSCGKGERIPAVVTSDYMIVGRVGGFTATNKVTFYKIGDGQLRADTSKNSTTIPISTDEFNFDQALPQARYDQVADLLQLVPGELIPHHNEHVGITLPDYGYLDVTIMYKGHQYRWYFEGDQSRNSPIIQGFVSRLNAAF